MRSAGGDSLSREFCIVDDFCKLLFYRELKGFYFISRRLRRYRTYTEIE